MGKSTGTGPAPTRYAVRQVLDQEHRKETLLRLSNARKARSTTLGLVSGEEHAEDKENAYQNGTQRRAAPAGNGVKRDFFGRITNNPRPVSAVVKADAEEEMTSKDERPRVWVSFNEGYSNAVRKPLTLKELLD